MENRRTARGHLSAEAFCLMKYRDSQGNEEWIWNSRDGVTPFMVTSRYGYEARHVDWHMDQYAPNYKPQPGERIFVTMTEEWARKFAERAVATWWDRPDHPDHPSQYGLFFNSREDAIDTLVQQYTSQPGAPAVVWIDEDGSLVTGPKIRSKEEPHAN